MTPDGTAYDIFGPQHAAVVVLIHGLGMTRTTWDDIAPALAQTFRVITYDLCGHGQSRLPAQPPSLTVLSKQLENLLDGLAVPTAVLVGFSLGGMINQRFAMYHPDRVRALVVLNSPHKHDPEAQRLVEERAIQTSAEGPKATIDATLERWFTPDFRKNSPSKVAQIRAWVLANDANTYLQHRQVLAHCVHELIQPDPALSAACLVMACAKDSGSTPAMSEAIAAEITGAETVIVPELQHLGLIEQPRIFLAKIGDFLTRKITLSGIKDKEK